MFKISTNQQDIQESTGGSKFISTSGVYDVVINFASVNVAASGAEQLAFNVTYNDNTQTFYGPYYKKKDGGDNPTGIRTYNALGIIAGMGEGDSPTAVEEEHKVGANNEERTFTVIEEFSDLPVKMQVTFKYELYNGSIQERKEIRGFFREDGANADEIVNDGEVGKQLAVVLEKYADKVIYGDGVTEEDVAAWKAAKASGGATPAPTVTKPKAKTSNLFGKK